VGFFRNEWSGKMSIDRYDLAIIIYLVIVSQFCYWLGVFAGRYLK